VAAPQEPRLATVEVMRVTPELLVDVAVFSGQLDAEHSVLVRPEIEGVVASVEFEQGQAVKENDVLFQLRSREQAARLREARANRDLARQRWKRAERLVERDASSVDAHDVAQAEYEVAQAREELAKLELDRTTIRAPFDGVVGQRLVDIGDRLEVETELVRVDAIERLQLTFGISDEGLSVAHPHSIRAIAASGSRPGSTTRITSWRRGSSRTSISRCVASRTLWWFRNRPSAPTSRAPTFGGWTRTTAPAGFRSRSGCGSAASSR
jgi:multidrug efflux pump subunit AcrA (membrane-fusion protein)